MKRPFATLVLSLTLASCADRPSPPARPVETPAPAASEQPATPAPMPIGAPLPDAGTADAAPAVADVPPPVRKAGRPLLTWEHVVLGAGMEKMLAVEPDGRSTYTEQIETMQPFPPIEGRVSEKSIERLQATLKRLRFCSIKDPLDTPLTHVVITIRLDAGEPFDAGAVPAYSPPATCRKRFAPADWPRRYPELMRDIKAIEEETCGGPCPGKRKPR